MDAFRKLRYSDGDIDIFLQVPWGPNTGQIPPPSIDFYLAGGEKRQFIYAGVVVSFA